MNLVGGFNWLDFLIFLVVIGSMIIGYSQGLLRQVIALAALYISVILGAQYYPLVSDWIRGLTFQTSTNKFLNAFAFFVILIFVNSVINWLAYDAYRSTKLRLTPLIDQFGGTVLGLVIAVVGISIAVPVITFATSEPWPWSETARRLMIAGIQTSQVLPIFNEFKPLLLSALLPWLPTGLPSLLNLYQ
jgi:uncharacterized membrane protein required for colicin V production